MLRTNVELHQEADMVSKSCVVVVVWCDINYDNAVAIQRESTTHATKPTSKEMEKGTGVRHIHLLTRP